MESHPLEKIIYLTFDDGPNEPYTSQILEVLARYSAKATFFVCGKNVEKYPDSVKKIASAGQAIGNHAYSHDLMQVLRGNLMSEIALTRSLIKHHAGVDTNLYRSPWGITMPWLAPRLRKNGYKIFHWHIMAFDWNQPSPAYISDHVARRAFNGAVVLLHDGNRTIGASRKNTVEALPMILEKLAARGYQFLALNNGIPEIKHKLFNLTIDNFLKIAGR